jgi:Tol biopolymer transport system component
LLAFVGRDPKDSVSSLWVRPLGSLAAHKIDRTEGANFPFWSPDGQFIGYFADQKLKKIPAAGGVAQTICDVENSSVLRGDGATWSQDDIILFSPARGPLRRVAATGGPSSPATALDAGRGEIAHTWPQFLPDGKHILYLARTPQGNSVYVQELGSTARTEVLKNATRAVFAPPGYLLWVRERTLMAQRLDLASLKLLGEPVPLAEDVNENPTNGRSAFAVSSNRLLVYRGGLVATMRQLSWYDRTGKRIGAVGEAGEFLRVALAPDEKRAAVTRANGSLSNANTWIMDMATGALTRATFDPNQGEMDPVWSPDSKQIAIRTGSGLARLTVATGVVEPIPSGGAVFAMDWSPDGRNLLCLDATLSKPFLLPLDGSGPPRTITETPFLKMDFRFSPDGKLAAYSSEESGKAEVYVATLPALGDKQRVSTGGGTKPVWRGDGKELFYIGGDGSLMEADINVGSKVEVGTRKALFNAGLGPGLGAQYAVTRDGKRFLLNQRGGVNPAGSSVTIVLNWAADLKP